DRAIEEALVDCDKIAEHSHILCGELQSCLESSVGGDNITVINVNAETLSVTAPTYAPISECISLPCLRAWMIDELGGIAVAAVDASLDIIMSTGIYYVTPTLSAGDHTVTIIAVDELGNQSSKTITFSVDGTAPKVDITAPAAGTFTSARPPFTATFSDEGAGVASVTATLDGKDVTSQANRDLAAGTLSFTPGTPLKDGAHTLKVTVTDVAGNSATDEITIQVDNTAPSLTIVSPASEESSQGAPLKVTYVTAGELVIKAAFEDAGSGIDPASVEMTIDGNKVETPTVSMTGVIYRPAVNELTVGPHDVTIKVADKQGNPVEATASFIVGAPELDVIEAYNFPNPFDNMTTIRVKLTKIATVGIKVYDMAGDLVATMEAGEVVPGKSGVADFNWGGTNDNGNQVANGVYFARIVVEDGAKTVVKVIKVALLR
ncbi:MAG: Ig-like domain-containing protein, partial [bacterium]|nr:Ig-like domain-containing protein [bacterium]